MNIDEIRARHEFNDLWIEADSDGEQAHEDRGVLLERIAELEAELEANQQSWQEHDQGRIFAAKQMRLRIAKLEKENRILRLKLAYVHLGQGDEDAVEELSGGKVEQEICPKCNQEMDSPHYCRPDWSGPSIGGKVKSNG